MSPNQHDSQELRLLWQEFLKSRDAVLRARLIGAYLDFAGKTTRKIIKDACFRGEMDGDEHLHAGVIGLLQAVDTYQLQENGSFETFCFLKIKGAILGQIRAFETSCKLWNAAWRSPEGLDRSAPPVEPYQQSEAARRSPSLTGPGDSPGILPPVHRHPRKLSLDQSRRGLGRDGDDAPWTDTLQDFRTREPLNELARQEVREIVTRDCTEVERLILVLYYYENMTMKQIAMALKRTEGRVCQIHAALLAKLRRRLRERKEELLAVTL
jgi:RNA polymerase sigma factor for flagellar operon FliA